MTKQQYIEIEWITGRPQKGAAEDERNAQAAAELIFDESGVDYLEAQEAYDRIMRGNDYTSSPRETALIAIWEAAMTSANVALTEGWYSPNGGACTIRAWATK